MLKLPIYIANGTTVGITATVLTPTAKCVVIFEDFDRYLSNMKEGSGNTIADILNALDGVDSNNEVMRFFTCNNPDIVRLNLAFMTRMNGTFKFDYPKFTELKERFNTLIKFHEKYDQGLYDTFLLKLETLIATTPIDYRRFTKFCIRYLFGDRWLETLIEKMGELVF